MTHGCEVGLFLADDAERDILRAAALSCGLHCVDLLPSASSMSPADIPPLIVTDKTTGPWESARCSTFSEYDAPTLLLVCDHDQPRAGSTSPLAASSASVAACRLTRPLRLDVVIITLRTALVP